MLPLSLLTALPDKRYTVTCPCWAHTCREHMLRTKAPAPLPRRRHVRFWCTSRVGEMEWWKVRSVRGRERHAQQQQRRYLSKALAQALTCLTSIVHVRVGRYSGLGHASSGDSSCFYYSWKRMAKRVGWKDKECIADGDKWKLASCSCTSRLSRARLLFATGQPAETVITEGCAAYVLLESGGQDDEADENVLRVCSFSPRFCDSIIMNFCSMRCRSKSPTSLSG